MEGILAIVFIFGGGTAFLLAISPVGRAIADRIRSGSAGSDEAVRRVTETQQAMLDDMDAMRQELTELQERLDFAERLLTQQREAATKLPPGAGASRAGE